MMYVRGSTADYDDWADFDSPGWEFKNVAKYFRKHQTLDPIDADVKDRGYMPFVEEFHGKDGPIHTSFNNWRIPFENNFMHACDEETGMDRRPQDPWSGDHIGFYSSLAVVDRTGNPGTRSYAASGYLYPNVGRPNLKVLPEAFATNLILDGNTAKGCKFIHGEQTHEVYAKQEVIVSCGTYKTPQLLELSGIGDPEVLRAAGVEPKVTNPGVGANFQDHILTILGYRMTPGNPSLDSLHDPKVIEEQQKIYMETQKGALASNSCCMGFFPYSSLVSKEELEKTIKSIEDTPNQTPFQKKQYEQVIAHLRNPKSANLQFVLIPATGDFDGGIEDQSKLFAGPKPGEPNGIVMAVCVEYPVSRGTVHITSSDPFKEPRIDPGYCSHPADAAVIAAGLALMDRVAKNHHCKDALEQRYEPSPELDMQNLENGAKFFKQKCMGEYHPIGTCGMGDVVDERLRVKGVNGLRVIDASIMPNNVSGNIMSSVYVIGEKGADLIKEDSPLFK
jgi:choline dehydrogenase-like flavoprotein